MAPSEQVPPVTRLVMFRHGVAYVERSGAAHGHFEMTFKRDEMNDVLKSLAVWIARGEGRVGAVAFEAPEDPNRALAARNLLLEPGQVASDLLHALRGRRVVVHTAGDERHEGEVLGVENSQDAHGALRRQLLLRASGNGRVVLVELAQATSITLQEAPSRADLEFFVDKSRAASAGESRSVTVALEGSAEALHVAYVVPAAIWRVSYRLVVDEDDRSTLMAWAIVHNPIDEDIRDVQLTLTTGQPVSFEIDLYGIKRVQRAVVEETSRAVAGPRSFERARPASRKRMVAPPPPAAAPAPQALAMPVSMTRSAGPPPSAEGFAGAADSGDRSEFFEYRLSTAISLKRGGSAMVPLASAQPKAGRQRIWREGAGDNPDLLLAFTNDSGMVLEEGPLVVYDGGSYAGEAMLPYSARSADVKLAFAKDLAVRCKRDHTRQSRRVAVTLGQQGVLEEHRHEIIHTLHADSDHDQAVTVTFELPRTHGRTLADDHLQPSEQTASFWRFAVQVPAHGTAEATVKEQWRQHLRVQYQSLGSDQLVRWLDDKHLDHGTFEALRGVVQAWQEAEQLDRDRTRAEEQRQGAYDKQSKISEQLGVLRETGPEGKLRLRYVEELGREQDRINALDQEINRLLQTAAELRARAARELQALTRTQEPTP